MTIRRPRDLGRARRMAELYRSGKTLQEIGDMYQISRERVRQLIAFLGLNRNSGGQTIKAIERARAAHTRRLEKVEAKYHKWFGCSKAAYLEICHEPFTWASKRRNGKTPGAAYIMQKLNAVFHRRIGWNLTFPDWWQLWQESGKWELRGRGPGYCMARYGDSGPYEVGNVYICTIGQNFSDSYLVKSWHERRQKVAA